MSILYDVHLDDFMWCCFAYAKRRVGRTDLSMKEFFNLREYPWPENLDNLPIGAVVVWDCNLDDPMQQWTLDIENDKIISTVIEIKEHYGVYEGDGLVSDLTFLHNDPHIRLRKFSEIQRKPRGYKLPMKEGRCRCKVNGSPKALAGGVCCECD